MFLLHANEPLSRERLIEELWADTAPPTVGAVLSVYLSRLRRLLGGGTGEQPLLTQAAGYVLRVPSEQYDARRFEALLGRGREELRSGATELAATTLRDALALWRGPALADLAAEPFAQGEIARLEELRLTGLDNRIEADLALGRQDALVAELESLVAAYPFREGLRAQLMLALYRSGRQAEALETYRHARRSFSEELGIEPGRRLKELEGAILRHDPSLEVSSPDAPRGREKEWSARGGTRRFPTRLMLAVVSLACVIAAALVAAGRDSWDDAPVPVKLAGNSVAVIDPGTSAIVDEVPVGGRPTGLAVGEGAVWVANRDDDTLLRIDPRSHEIVRTIGLGVKPTNIAVGAGGVWVLSDWALLRVDPHQNDVVATIRLPRRESLGFPWLLVEVGSKAVWVCSCATISGALAHIDSDTNSIVFMREGPVGVIAYGANALWALTGYELDTVERIDPQSNAVLARISRGRIGEIGGGDPRRLAVGAGALWSASAASLWRVDLTTGRFTGSIALGHRPGSVAVGSSGIWVATDERGLVLRIDPVSQRVVSAIPLGPVIRPAVDWDAIAVGDGAVWVAVTSLAS